MPQGQVELVLRAASETNARAGSPDCAQALRLLADGFAMIGPVTVEQVAQAMNNSEPQSSVGPTLEAAAHGLFAAAPSLRLFGSTSQRSAVKKLEGVLNNNRGMTIRSILERMSEAYGFVLPSSAESLADAYVRLLSKAQHDADAFPSLVASLETDKRVNRSMMAEIASRFAFKTPSSTSRATSLERISRMHVASQTQALKSDAMKGKSAA